jgi:hypothetical protein
MKQRMMGGGYESWAHETSLGVFFSERRYDTLGRVSRV